MAIGKRIKQARESRGMSREQLAAEILVTPSSISKYENDISHPKEPILYKLIEVLRVDANFLFQDTLPQKEKTATNEGNGFTDKQRKLMDSISELDEEGQKQAFAYIEFLKSKRST